MNELARLGTIVETQMREKNDTAEITRMAMA